MRRIVASGLPIILLLAACSGGGATSSPTSAPPSTAPSAATASESVSSPAASEAASASTSASGPAIEAKPVGSIGTVLVAGSNGMTVYTFTKDVKDSGTSACTGGCLTTWPALTVADKSDAIAGTGVTGKIGTITRADDGTYQVTYNGLPLYFFKNDKAPGDANGVYANWEAVKP